MWPQWHGISFENPTPSGNANAVDGEWEVTKTFEPRHSCTKLDLMI